MTLCSPIMLDDAIFKLLHKKSIVSSQEENTTFLDIRLHWCLSSFYTKKRSSHKKNYKKAKLFSLCFQRIFPAKEAQNELFKKTLCGRLQEIRESIWENDFNIPHLETCTPLVILFEWKCENKVNKHVIAIACLNELYQELSQVENFLFIYYE